MRAPIIGGHRRAYRPRMPARLPAAPTWRRTLAALLLALVPRSNRFMAGLSFKAMLAAMQLADSGLSGDPFEESGPDDYPVWQFLDTEREPPSVANLSRDLTINGTTVSPTFWYKGEDAGGTTWPAEVGGAAGLLTEAGSGASPSYSQGCPLMRADESVKYNGAKTHAAAGNDHGDVTTEDMVFEAIVNWKDYGGAAANVVSHYGGTSGWRFYQVTNTSMRFNIRNAASNKNIASAAVADGYNHIVFILHRSGFGQAYVNGISSAAAVDISAVAASITRASPLTLGSTAWASNIVHAALWLGDAWLDSHNQAALVAERFRALTGTRPQIAAGSSVPNTMSRNSVAYIEKYNTSTAATELYKVGAHWPKIWKRKDKNGVVGIYYWPETAATNSCKGSNALDDTDWTEVNNTTNADAGTSPTGDVTLDAVVTDDAITDTQHGWTQAVTTTAAAWLASCIAIKGAHDWLYISDDTIANGWCYFDLNTGVVGNSGAGATGTIVPWGSTRYRCFIEFTGTAAAHTFAFYASDADDNAADPAFVGDGVSDEVYVGHVQIEPGVYPSSVIDTAVGATATRLKDEMQFPGLANIGGVGSEKQGAVVSDVLRPDYDAPAGYFVSLSDGGQSAERIILIQSSLDVAQFYCSESGVQWDVSGSTDLANGYKHTVATAWKTNLAILLVDGAEEGTRDTSNSPTIDLDRIDIGQSQAGAGQPNGGIRNIRIYRRCQHGTRWAA